MPRRREQLQSHLRRHLYSSDVILHIICNDFSKCFRELFKIITCPGLQIQSSAKPVRYSRATTGRNFREVCQRAGASRNLPEVRGAPEKELLPGSSQTWGPLNFPEVVTFGRDGSFARGAAARDVDLITEPQNRKTLNVKCKSLIGIDQSSGPLLHFAVLHFAVLRFEWLILHRIFAVQGTMYVSFTYIVDKREWYGKDEA